MPSGICATALMARNATRASEVSFRDTIVAVWQGQWLGEVEQQVTELLVLCKLARVNIPRKWIPVRDRA